MIANTKNNWRVGLVLILVTFIVVKSQDLNIPYFWDELGVYAPGSLKMKDSGQIGILPINLDPEYSRGHPLLCFFFHALTFKFFGDTVLVAHATSLFTGCCILIAGFLFIRSVFSEKAALLYVFLMALQPFFYAMSGIIAPENLLTLFSILSVWAIVKRKWLLYAIAGSLAILTKESAIVIPGTALLFLLIQSIKERRLFTWGRMAAFFAAGTPILVFIAFLLIQKAQNGWYFFPLHVNLMQFGMHDINYKLNRMFATIFLDQGRWLICIPGILYIICEAIVPSPRKETRDAILLIVLFLILSEGFASINFYLDRYTLYALPFAIMLGAQAFVAFAGLFNKKAVRIILPLLFCGYAVFAGIKNMDPKEFHDSIDMAYKHTVYTVADCIHWGEKQPWAYEFIDASFPVFQALDDKRNGYINGKPWPHSANVGEGNARYGIYFHLENQEPYMPPKQYNIIKRFDREYAHILIVEYK